MNRKLLIFLVLLVIVLAGGAFVYKGILYKDARDINGEEAAYNLPAAKLIGDYTTKQAGADSLYLNKTIQIEGLATQVSDSVITVDGKVFCSFDVKPSAECLNKKISIKGRCIGFDELFGEVKLDQCSIQQ
jgi:hypothetical protein